MQRFVRAILRKWSVHLHRGRLQPKKVRHRIRRGFLNPAHSPASSRRSTYAICCDSRAAFLSSSAPVPQKKITIELGSVIIHDADVFDHPIMDLPFFVEAMEVRDDPPTLRPSRARPALFPTVFFHRRP